MICDWSIFTITCTVVLMIIYIIVGQASVYSFSCNSLFEIIDLFLIALSIMLLCRGAFTFESVPDLTIICGAFTFGLN